MMNTQIRMRRPTYQKIAETFSTMIVISSIPVLISLLVITLLFTIGVLSAKSIAFQRNLIRELQQDILKGKWVRI